MSTKKAGRPPVDSERLDVRLPRDLIEGIERYGADEPDKPTRHETVRRIIRDWLIGHSYLQ